MEFLLYVLALVITGIVAGFASGMIGVGGCFIMVPVQYWLLTADGLDGTLAIRVAFGTGLAVTLPTVMSAAYGHSRRGGVDWQTAVPMGLSAICGAVTGGAIAAGLPGQILKFIFSLLVIIMAIRMIWDVGDTDIQPDRRSYALLLSIGFGVGIITSLAGVGGGVVMIPILVLLMHFPMHRAVGTSSACLIFSSAGAVLSYIWYGIGVDGLPAFSIGYVDILQWGILTATTIPISVLGVRYAHRCPPRTLRYFFAVLMLVVGVLMLISR